MQIVIKTLTGRKQQLNFDVEETVLAVKQALQEKEGIQVDQIRCDNGITMIWRENDCYYALICISLHVTMPMGWSHTSIV